MRDVRRSPARRTLSASTLVMSLDSVSVSHFFCKSSISVLRLATRAQEEPAQEHGSNEVENHGGRKAPFHRHGIVFHRKVADHEDGNSGVHGLERSQEDNDTDDNGNGVRPRPCTKAGESSKRAIYASQNQQE